MTDAADGAQDELDARALADLLPVLVWATDEHGARTYFNSSWLDFRGRTLEQELGMGWSAAVHPDDADRYLSAYRSAIERHEPFELTHRLRRHDGVYRWVLARGRPWYSGTEFIGYLGATTDVTAQVEAEVQLREHRDALHLALAAAGMGTWVWRADRDEVMWDERMAELTGAGGEKFSATFAGWIGLMHPDDRERVSAIIDDAVARRGSLEFEYRVVRPDGLACWLETRGEVFETADGRLGGTRGVAVDVTTRKETDAALGRVTERLALLAEAGAVLGSSLELTDTLRDLGQVLVTSFADSFEIDLVDGEGLRRFVIGRDARVSLRELDPLPDDPEHPMRRVLRTRRGEVLRIAESPDDFGPPDVPTSARSLGMTAALVVPIVVRASVLGVLALAWRDEPDDLLERLDVAEDLASRAGLAIDNARLFESQRSASIRLQRSLLPDDLNVPDGFRVAARYHPGDAGLEVGGDWYDAAVDAHGRLHLSVGDVVGKGIEAASTMIRARTTLRTLMFEHPPAVAVNGLADLPHVMRAGYMTVLAGTIEPTGRATFVSAGHPPPLVISPAGDVVALDVQFGCPLGFDMPRSYVEATHELAAGSRLVAFTDGLVERRGASIDDGLQQLRDALVASHHQPIEQVADFLLSHMLPARAEDDAAFIIVELPA